MAAAKGAHFVGDVHRVPRRKELAFLHIDRAAGFRSGFKQVGLTAQKRGDLQQIEPIDVRLALSKDALKMKWMPVRSAMSLSERAMSHAKDSDSSEQGPRMKKGTGPPTGTWPMLNGSNVMML
jgi:hypothetical protein